MKFANVIERLKPARWRKAQPLTPKERFVLWKQVAPGDAGLRATVDLLGEMLKTNADLSMTMEETTEKRMQALDAASVVRGILFAIEDEWQAARTELANETKTS